MSDELRDALEAAFKRSMEPERLSDCGVCGAKCRGLILRNIIVCQTCCMKLARKAEAAKWN